MRELERDGEHIWLRQSVTFTVDGQTRTIEIAVPLRPGATSGEVEALLREAQEGMARLTRDLDAQVAAIANGAPLSVASAPTVPAMLPPASNATADAETPSAPAAAPHIPTPSATTPTPAPSRPAPTPATPPPATPAPEMPATARAQPSDSLVRETPAPPAGPPMDLREFLSTARSELDLMPPQIMSRLGVKSLSGINYREALENLRRQALRGEGSANPMAPASVPPSRPAPASPTPQPARYFEEELDEPEVTFSVEGEGPHGPDFGTYDEAGEFDSEGNEYDDLALGDDEEDVPDFGPPPAPAQAARETYPTRPLTASRAPEPPVPAPVEGGDSGERVYAMQLIGQFRSATAGGTPSMQQRSAFRNILVQELGPEKAKAVVQGLYRVPLERLGPEQLDTLISWGKRETFGADVELVLEALRAEREHAERERTGSAPAPAANGAAPRPSARGRPAPRTATER